MSIKHRTHKSGVTSSRLVQSDILFFLIDRMLQKHMQYCRNIYKIHLKDVLKRQIIFFHTSMDLRICHYHLMGEIVHGKSFVMRLVLITKTRKVTKGYLLSFFGGAIEWKATKQKTVTTSETEVELLALSSIGSSNYWWKRFFFFHKFCHWIKACSIF